MRERERRLTHRRAWPVICATHEEEDDRLFKVSMLQKTCKAKY